MYEGSAYQNGIPWQFQNVYSYGWFIFDMLYQSKILFIKYSIHTQVQIFVNIFIESVHYSEENRFNN